MNEKSVMYRKDGTSISIFVRFVYEVLNDKEKRCIELLLVDEDVEKS